MTFVKLQSKIICETVVMYICIFKKYTKIMCFYFIRYEVAVTAEGKSYFYFFDIQRNQQALKQRKNTFLNSSAT